MKKIIFISCVLLSFTSCAAIMRMKCNPEYAAKKGMEDAEKGLLSQPSKTEGASCEGEYSPSSFSKDYMAGFGRKKAEVCQVSMAASYGKADGDAGNGQKPQKAKLSLCSESRDYKKIENAYEREFMTSFCALGRASRMGTSQGGSLQPADYEAAFGSCPAKLKKTYMDAYRVAVAGFCTVEQARQLGVTEATAKRGKEVTLPKMSRCTEMGKDDVRIAFERSYDETRARVDREDADRAAQEAERVRVARAEEFKRSVTTRGFMYQNQTFISRCNVAPDRSYIQVEVENPNGNQVLMQGEWKIIYYGGDFNKITEDKTTEALLLTPNNKKVFQKMTLPRDASYCRSEYMAPPVVRAM